MREFRAPSVTYKLIPNNAIEQTRQMILNRVLLKEIISIKEKNIKKKLQTLESKE